MIRPAAIDPPEIDAHLWKEFGGGGGTGGVGWDIGANCGQSMRQMCSRFLRVHAFEPAVECYEYLVPWVTGVRNHIDIQLHQLALSNIDGDIELAAIPDKIDTGQLVTAGTQGMEWSESLPSATARTVPARTIDSLVQEIGPFDFCKIDVEGHEMLVLEGGQQTICDYMPDMLIEFHNQTLFGQILQCLQQHGYRRLETVRHPHYRPHSEMWHNHGWIRAFAEQRSSD